MSKKFTPQAAKFWENIPESARKALLSNVWCGQCRGTTTIIDFKGEIKQGDLVLSGFCKACNSPVARLIESA
jgi:hypothetical protein